MRKNNGREDRLKYLRTRIAQLEEFFLTSGEVSSLTTDGGSTTFDRAGAREELKQRKEELLRLEGKRGWIRKIDMT